MQLVSWLILLMGGFALWCACGANRRTSLLQAVQWAIISWTTWVVALALLTNVSQQAAVACCYLALCLTGCAGVAVLGARRPGVGPWNFVVLALLVVQLLPLAQALLRGNDLHLEVIHVVCVAATLAVGILNYLPTCLAPASLLLLVSAILFLALIVSADSDSQHEFLLRVGSMGLAFVPWVASWSAPGGKRGASEFDRRWLDFRNRFGLVWAQRLREQFNRSAAHAGWPVILRWPGLRRTPGTLPPPPDMQTAIVATLRALMKRFGPEEELAEGSEKQKSPPV